MPMPQSHWGTYKDNEYCYDIKKLLINSTAYESSWM